MDRCPVWLLNHTWCLQAKQSYAGYQADAKVSTPTDILDDTKAQACILAIQAAALLLLWVCCVTSRRASGA